MKNPPTGRGSVDFVSTSPSMRGAKSFWFHRRILTRHQQPEFRPGLEASNTPTGLPKVSSREWIRVAT